MLDNLKKYRIFLASNSPRRREIMRMLRIPFTSVSIEGIDETFPSGLPLEEIPLYIANKKCDAYLQRLKDNDLVITADTMVICEDRILGKPRDVEEAKEMLRFLSGRSHLVSTGVSLATSKKREAFVSLSEVLFAKISETEINYYVDNFHPFDKAGAYGIQEWIGAVAVASIKGSFYNVMGLPIHQVFDELKKFH